MRCTLTITFIVEKVEAQRAKQFLKVTELQMEKPGSELDSLAPESVLLTTMCAQHTVLGDHNFQEGMHKLSSEREGSQPSRNGVTAKQHWFFKCQTVLKLT